MSDRRPPTSIDLAKASLIPLVLGFFTSAAYYSHFRVPAVSLLSPQCIVTGLYVVITYALIPWWVREAVSRCLSTRWIRVVGTTIVLVIIGAAACYGAERLAGQSVQGATIGLALGVPLQLTFLKLAASRGKSSTLRDSATFVTLSIGGVVAAILCCLHFAIFAFPYIPYYFAGGRPIRVYAIPAADSKPVLDDIFFNRKDMPQTNPELPTYQMTLLYETSDDYYFLSQRRGAIEINQQSATNVFYGTIVSRVRRNVVARLDYSTPTTINLKELFK